MFNRSIVWINVGEKSNCHKFIQEFNGSPNNWLFFCYSLHISIRSVKSERNVMEWRQMNWLIDEGVDPWIYTQGKGV
jgi:hypothetical protein